MIRKSINKLFTALLVIMLSIALIGCEASPKKNSADGGNTPPPVEEDPKEKFIGKWFYEVEDEVYVVEIVCRDSITTLYCLCKHVSCVYKA